MRIWSWQHVSVSISSVAELSPVYCCLLSCTHCNACIGRSISGQADLLGWGWWWFRLKWFWENFCQSWLVKMQWCRDASHLEERLGEPDDDDDYAYLIFVLFSPQTKILAQFFSTPKRVNSDKTDFATKQRKLHKREILQQNSIKCDKTSKIVHIIYFVHNILI